MDLILQKSIHLRILKVRVVSLFDSRFDFAVFGDDGRLDFLIEYQGRQHYEPSSKFGGKRGFYQQQYNDNLKRRFCALHDFILIEIPYTEENLISYDYILKKAAERGW